jgi:hypothetical protein
MRVYESFSLSMLQSIDQRYNFIFNLFFSYSDFSNSFFTFNSAILRINIVILVLVDINNFQNIRVI